MMTNDTIKLFPHDRLLAKTVLRLIPRSVTPNQLTILRLCLTPVVLFFLWREDWLMALIWFLLAACTDALDGSLARTRRQITVWGTMADPVADKLLIGLVVVLFVARQINVIFAGIIVLIECMIVVGALYKHRQGGYMSANEFGKLKMLFQVIGVALLILAKVTGMDLAVPVAIGTLTIAIVFAVVSLLTYGF